MVEPAETRSRTYANRPEGRRGNRGLNPLTTGLIVIATLTALNTIYNGVQFGHWDPLYAQPVISQ